MVKRYSLIGSIFLLLVVFSSVQVHAGGVGVGYATEFTQLANHGELVAQYGQQVQEVADQAAMVAKQLQEYQNMLQNTAALPNQITGVWQGAMADLQSLQQVVSKGQALAYTFSNLDQAFNQRYPGYSHFCNTNMSGADFQNQYSQWSQQTLDTCRDSLAAANLQYQDFTTEDETMQQLQKASQSATGRMQVLQAGNEIAGQLVYQMQRLRQLILSQIDMQSQYMAEQQSEQNMDRGQRQQFYQATSLPQGTGQGYSSSNAFQ